MQSIRTCQRLSRSLVSQRVSMSTIRYHETGPAAQVLKVEDDDVLPTVSANQVKLKMLAAPINPADLNIVEGGYGITPSFPAVGGGEGVAVVTEVGSGVTTLAKDDRVIPHSAGFGTWRSFAVADESELIKLPNDLPVEIAATLAVNPCTAYRLLEDFVELKEGDVVVQNGANSAVGQAVVQLAALRGIKTINVMRHSEDYEQMNERLKGLGGDIVCTSDYFKTAEFRRLISDLPEPKLGLNCTGGTDATNIGRALGHGATLVTYGGMSKQPVTIPTSTLIFKDLKSRGFWMSEWIKTHSKEEREAMLSELADLAKSGKLVTWVERFKFSQFEEALSAVKNRQTRRKVLLMMDE